MVVLVLLVSSFLATTSATDVSLSENWTVAKTAPPNRAAGKMALGSMAERAVVLLLPSLAAVRGVDPTGANPSTDAADARRAATRAFLWKAGMVFCWLRCAVYVGQGKASKARAVILPAALMMDGMVGAKKAQS